MYNDGDKFELFWVSEDGQNELFGGRFDTREDAENDIPRFKRELIGVCANESERAGIMSGELQIFGRVKSVNFDDDIFHKTCWTEGNGTWHLMRKGNEIIKIEDSLHALAVTQGAEDILQTGSNCAF